MEEKIIDKDTGAELKPGNPENCPGNGQYPDFEICREECDYWMECFPEDAAWYEEKKKRNNPKYPPHHCFTVVKCKECGEYYEPICALEHICKKQNSHPIKDEDEE